MVSALSPNLSGSSGRGFVVLEVQEGVVMAEKDEKATD